MDKILIKSVGRTGSHIISEYFKNCGYYYVQIHFDGEIDKDVSDNIDLQKIIESKEKLVVYSHDVNYIPKNTETFVLISSVRRNKFDQYCSFEVAQKTNQWTKYKKNVDKISIEKSKDINGFIYAYTQYQNTVLQQSRNYKWNDFKEIYYEDIINSIDYLKKIFPLKLLYTNKVFEKSPYNYSNIIVDYENLNKLYGEK